jgi:circadian clock protein KaiC
MVGAQSPRKTPLQAEGTPPAGDAELLSTGIAGLDDILGGGLPAHHIFLVQGTAGSGKTTLGLQFCLAGAARGERVLYLTTCESEAEIREIAAAHNWSLDGVTVHYYDALQCLGTDSEQSVFHPAEVELPKSVGAILTAIQRCDCQRLVIDSLSEIRYLAVEPRWFRRQMLALKADLTNRNCTALFCDDRAQPRQPIESIVHGVIDLEQVAPDYGPDRRRIRVRKLRGQPHRSGYHDFRIRTGGIDVYPRLAAADYRDVFQPETISSGLPALDQLFGGGADRGTATLLLGPAGAGKSIVATQFAVAAAQRGERSVMYVFDERIQTLVQRATGLGLPLQDGVDQGRIELRQIDAAELTAGEFSHAVRQAVEQQDAQLVIIDSLIGYAHAMPDERQLTLYLHELLAYLSQRGVTVLMIMAQHGLPGTLRAAPFDLSYIADCVLLFHLFEYRGGLCKAISLYKRRGGAHERMLRELDFGSDGILIGEPLRQFRGILSGVPDFLGEYAPHAPGTD